MAYAIKGDDVFVGERMRAARAGQGEAAYELGLVFSVGRHGVDVDLIEAHKWLNLAAIAGVERAKIDRAEVAADMTRLEIVEAQKRARAFMSGAVAA